MAGCCKYYKQKKQVSYDSGVTWQDVYPEEYIKGELFERDSNDCCSYNPCTEMGLIRMSDYDPDGDNSICGGQCCRDNVSRYSINDTVGDTPYFDVYLGDCIKIIDDYAFEELPHLRHISIDSGVTSMGNYAFLDSNALIEVFMRGTTPPTIGTDIFRNINPVPTIYVPDSAVNTYKAASGWSTYSSYIQPASLKGRKLYVECGNDVYIQDYDGIPKVYTDNLCYGDFFQNSMSAMTYFEVGDCVEYIYSTNNFNYFTNLTGISFGNNVKYIGGGIHNTKLTSLTLPASIEIVSDLRYNEYLTGITCLAETPPTIGSNAFNRTNNCPIYVPAGSVNAYKAATNWSAFASRIQAIP